MDKHKEALKVLHRMPLAEGIKVTDTDATLLASVMTTAGTFVPVISSKFHRELEKFTLKAEKKWGRRITHWLNSERLRRIIS